MAPATGGDLRRAPTLRNLVQRKKPLARARVRGMQRQIAQVRRCLIPAAHSDRNTGLEKISYWGNSLYGDARLAAKPENYRSQTGRSLGALRRGPFLRLRSRYKAIDRAAGRGAAQNRAP